MLFLVIRAVDNPANSSDTEETIVQNVAEVSVCEYVYMYKMKW